MAIWNSRLVGKIDDRLDRASGYVLAFAATCTATGVRYAIQMELQERNRMLLFIPAVLISAWYGGVGPGVFSLLLGAILCAWILIPSVASINLGDRVEQVGMLLYLAIGAGVILLVHRERTEKLRREIAQRALEELNASLEERVRERTKELQVANRELEGFCYNISHDLRTPARAISSNVHILIEDYKAGLDEPIQQKLMRISDAAVKLGDIVDALLSYARLARADLAHEAVDLRLLIETEAKHWQHKSGGRFSVGLPETMVVLGDRLQLGLAVSAIVGNSALYCKRGQIVRLEVQYELRGSEAIVRFGDNGIGFDTQYLHKIFQPFQRLQGDSEYPGIGMGLAHVARVAERHNGSISAESIQGEGSTFTLILGDQRQVTIGIRELIPA